ncbi:MAG: M14 family metallopeptidase [bacterium]
MFKNVLILCLLAGYISAQSFEWKTKFENSNFKETSNYDESIQYFKKIEKNSNYAKLFKLGVTPQGRDLFYFVVNKDKEFDLGKIKASKKSIVLIQNGIHAGEIEGKDACMLLLRDILITKDKEDLLDKVVIIIIPVINADGHERISKYNRINQDGPLYMGWRTTAQNLNLNRDYLKADAPEIKAFIKLVNNVNPDIFIDTHTTDGLDMQPVITFAVEGQGTVPPVLSTWIQDTYNPFIEKFVTNKGFIIAPFVNLTDNGNPSKGMNNWVSSPKLSAGYMAIRNRVGVLIETHSLKPYKERVFSTLAFIEGTLNLANSSNTKIKQNSKLADELVKQKYGSLAELYPVGFKLTKDSVSFTWKGINAELKESIVAGGKVLKYNGEKYEKQIQFFPVLNPSKFAKVPKYYVIPQEWETVIDILKLHGLNFEKIKNDTTVSAEQYKFKNVIFAELPYEGRFQPTFDYETTIKTIPVNKGDYVFYTNQPLIGILIYLLEPNTNDSFLKWGFFNIIFEQKEYFEIYSMEPIAQKMYDENSQLREEFNNKINSDEKFKNSIEARLNFFYEKSEYYDKKFNIYPVLKVY